MDLTRIHTVLIVARCLYIAFISLARSRIHIHIQKTAFYSFSSIHSKLGNQSLLMIDLSRCIFIPSHSIHLSQHLFLLCLFVGRIFKHTFSLFPSSCINVYSITSASIRSRSDRDQFVGLGVDQWCEIGEGMFGDWLDCKGWNVGIQCGSVGRM